MYRFDRRTLVVVGVVLVLGSLTMLVFERSSTQASMNTTSNDFPGGLGQGDVPHQRTGLDSKTKSRDQESRETHLSKLKQRWMLVGKDIDKNGTPTNEQKALAEESARLLLASHQALELIDFLAANDMKIAGYLVRDSVGTLFASSFSADARKALVELTNHAESAHPYISEWCFGAGLGCEQGEVASFRDQIPAGPYAQEVTFGQNLKLARTNPKEAIMTTLDTLKSGEVSLNQREILKKIMQTLPEDSDFASIEALLPKSKSQDSPITAGRTGLFQKWAKKDPAAAANYVMEHTDKLEPRLISEIASVVVKGDKRAGLEWVQTFPEGPYFDAAAGASVPYLYQIWPDQTAQIIALIEDPKLKKQYSEYLPKKKKNK